MKKCDCYCEQYEISGWLGPYEQIRKLKTRCNGTRERDECSCGGDRTKCDFYPEVKEKAKKERSETKSLMKWNVLCHNINSHKIEEYNIFKHSSFAKDIAELSNQDLTKEDYAEKLKRILQYYFWSKAEHEVVITSWPPYVDGEELSRINKEYEEYNEKWGHYPYKIDICPDVGRKIDIYTQVMLNFDVFCDYVWNYKEEKR